MAQNNSTSTPVSGAATDTTGDAEASGSSSSSPSPSVGSPNKKLSRKMSVLFAFERIFSKERRSHEKDDERAPLCEAASSHIPPPKTPRIPAALRSQQSLRLLRVYHLVGITFFAVTSGPFGFEGTVGAVGPVLMQIGLMLFQILWSAPLALMTAELSCMIPLTGGHVLWIYRAFGPFWSFVNSCFAFTCSILDNALYAVLFVEYLSSLLYGDNHSISHAWSIVLRVLVIVLVTILNITGIRIIGIAALALMVAVLSPFAAMIVWGLPRLNFKWIHGQTPKHIDLGKFITLLLWNSSGEEPESKCGLVDASIMCSIMAGFSFVGSVTSRYYLCCILFLARSHDMDVLLKGFIVI